MLQIGKFKIDVVALAGLALLIAAIAEAISLLKGQP